MAERSARARSTIYTFRDFPNLQAVCKKCGQMTTINLGDIAGGCSHIDVKFCDDDGVA